MVKSLLKAFLYSLSIIAIIVLSILFSCSVEDVRPQGEKILKAEKISPEDSVVLVRCGTNLPKQ